MTYPPAPWTLKGYAIQTFNLIDISTARNFIPPELEIISVFPSKTLGGIYISRYQIGSTLIYNELIVVAGLCHYQGQIGSWISHIYVDHPDSVAGGREIWGLPKQLAEFQWTEKDCLISRNNQTLCQINYQKNFLSFLQTDQKFSAIGFSGLEQNLLSFSSEFRAKVNSIDTQTTIPDSSPFHSLNVTKPFFSIEMNELVVIAGIPAMIGQMSILENRLTLA